MHSASVREAFLLKPRRLKNDEKTGMERRRARESDGERWEIKSERDTVSGGENNARKL